MLYFILTSVPLIGINNVQKSHVLHTRAQNEETRGCAFACKDKPLVAKGKRVRDYWLESTVGYGAVDENTKIYLVKEGWMLLKNIIS